MGNLKNRAWSGLRWALLLIGAYIADYFTKIASDRTLAICALLVAALVFWDNYSFEKRVEQQLNDLQTEVDDLRNTVDSIESMTDDNDHGPW